MLDELDEESDAPELDPDPDSPEPDPELVSPAPAAAGVALADLPRLSLR